MPSRRSPAIEAMACSASPMAPGPAASARLGGAEGSGMHRTAATK